VTPSHTHQWTPIHTLSSPSRRAHMAYTMRASCTRAATFQSERQRARSSPPGTTHASLHRDKPPWHRAAHAPDCLAGSPARRPARQQG
jgi:hypothetical protein